MRVIKNPVITPRATSPRATNRKAIPSSGTIYSFANGNITTKKLALFSPPTAYQAARQQPTGSRFGADALYQGENRKSGALISYYINRPAKKKEEIKSTKKKTNEDEIKSEGKKTVKYDSIKLEVFDGNRQIRTLKFKAPKENGIHKTRWFLREKGVARASRRISKSKREPSGVSVKPGTYKLKMTLLIGKKYREKIMNEE